MRILFNLGLSLLLAYLVANAAMSAEEGERPFVQLIAGMGVLAMLAFCFVYGLKTFRITRLWSFSAVWIAFIAMMACYYLLALVDLPSQHAAKSPRNLFVGIYIIATAVFIYYGVIYRHLTDRKLFLVIGFLIIGGLLDL